MKSFQPHDILKPLLQYTLLALFDIPRDKSSIEGRKKQYEHVRKSMSHTHKTSQTVRQRTRESIVYPAAHINSITIDNYEPQGLC